jgi:F-type H+-transporting ATPase subunit b
MGEFNAGTLFWALIVFGTLLTILSRYAYKPFNELLAKREKTIRDSLDEAAKARAGAEDLLARNEIQLTQARDQAREVLDEGHRIVTTMKQEAQEQAKQEADAFIARTRKEIQQETQRSLDELKSTVAGLSVRIARQVIRENINEERHEELADTFIERLKKSHGNRTS